MPPLIILEIIKIGMEITLEIIRGIPIEERQAQSAAIGQALRDHDKRMEPWLKLFEKLFAGFDKDVVKP